MQYTTIYTMAEPKLYYRNNAVSVDNEDDNDDDEDDDEDDVFVLDH